MSKGQGACGPNGRFIIFQYQLIPSDLGRQKRIRTKCKRRKWLREERNEKIQEITQKTLQFRTRYEFKPAEMKGTLNDKRKNARTNTGDSRNRKENYRLPPAHLFEESLGLQFRNAARLQWKIWVKTSGSRSTNTDYFKMWSIFETLHSVTAFNELSHCLWRQLHVWLLDHIRRLFRKRHQIFGDLRLFSSS